MLLSSAVDIFRSFKLLVSHWFKLLKDELSPTKVKYSDAYFAVKSSLSLETKGSRGIIRRLQKI